MYTYLQLYCVSQKIKKKCCNTESSNHATNMECLDCMIIATVKNEHSGRGKIESQGGPSKERHIKDEVLINIHVQELYKISYKHSKST
jgi:hypothetical protein